MDPTSLLWHYTIGQNFQLILADQAIKPSSIYTGTKDWPVVWFSRNQVWDASTTKGVETADGTWKQLTSDELQQVGGGLYRIGVTREVAPFNWDEFVKRSGISPTIAGGLKRLARDRSANHKDWFVSFDPVEQLKWAAIETWQNHQWVKVDPNPHPGFGVGWKS